MEYNIYCINKNLKLTNPLEHFGSYEETLFTFHILAEINQYFPVANYMKHPIIFHTSQDELLPVIINGWEIKRIKIKVKSMRSIDFQIVIQVIDQTGNKWEMESETILGSNGSDAVAKIIYQMFLKFYHFTASCKKLLAHAVKMN